MSFGMQGGLLLTYSADHEVDNVQLEKNLNTYFWPCGSWGLDTDLNCVYFEFPEDFDDQGYHFLVLENDEFEEVHDCFVSLAHAICPCINKGHVEIICMYANKYLEAFIISLKFYPDGRAELEKVEVENGELSKIIRSYKIFNMHKDVQIWYSAVVNKSDLDLLKGKFCTDNLKQAKEFSSKHNLQKYMNVACHPTKFDAIQYLDGLNEDLEWIDPAS